MAHAACIDVASPQVLSNGALGWRLYPAPVLRSQSRAKQSAKALPNAARFMQLALPNHESSVTVVPQELQHVPVTLLIPDEFLAPETLVGLRHRGQKATLMLVPKAPVHENGPMPSSVRQIGGAWQIFVLEAIVQTYIARDLPYRQFLWRTRASHLPHLFGSALAGEQRQAIPKRL